jgi:hypothetical protein
LASSIALATLIALGLSLDAPDSVSDVATQLPIEAVVLPPPELSASAWFCPGGVPGDSTAITDDTEDDTEATPVSDLVFVTNTSDRDAAVLVTALSASQAASRDSGDPDSGDADSGRPDSGRVARRFPVAAGTSIEIAVSELTAAPDAAVIVEPFSDGIIVEEQVGAPGRDDVAIAPCATETSPTWYFAAGSTVKGSSQWLSLLNPYSADAVVDITLVTNDEVRHPSDLQSLVVEARSRTSVFINDAADRKTVVSVIVKAQGAGRVVAQQSIVHRNVAGRSGVSSALGAVTPSTRFTFASGSRRNGNSRLLFIMNPGAVPTDVDVQIAAEDTSATTPFSLTIDAESVKTVNINKLVPTGTRYSIIVQAAADFRDDERHSSERGIVAEDFEGFKIETRARSVFGVAGGIGAIDPASEWRFGRSRLDGASTGQLAIYNPNESKVTVDVAFVVDGRLVRPAAAQGVDVLGASSAVIRIDGLVDANVGMIVTADRAVYVERLLVRDETATRAAGVPRRS